jgi:uncharacterized protein YceK
MRVFALVAVAVALSGCGTMENVRANQAAHMQQFNATIPVCTNDQECKLAWATARNWVITTCGMKIQNISDGYIETYGSSTTALACRVMGEPRPNGAWALVMRTTCGNMFGCSPDAQEAALQFNRHVQAAIDQSKASSPSNP